MWPSAQRFCASAKCPYASKYRGNGSESGGRAASVAGGSRGGSIRGLPLGIAKEREDRLAERRDRALAHDDPRDAVRYDVADRADLRRDARPAARARFNQGEGQEIVFARAEDDLGAIVQVHHFLAGQAIEESHRLPDPQVSREPPELPEFGTRPADRESDLRLPTQ